MKLPDLLPIYAWRAEIGSPSIPAEFRIVLRPDGSMICERRYAGRAWRRMLYPDALVSEIGKLVLRRAAEQV